VDTRSKILTGEAARERWGGARGLPGRPAIVVTGFFDVLRAEQIHELRAAREGAAGPLLAIVLPRAGELLEQRARAEMAAALRMVDYVVAADEAGAECLIASLQPAAVLRMEDADARRAAQLIEHVRQRQTR
jgi:bifunctional ADP-heptose synthase (sugar kinase/adenylyltransferase)